MSHNPSLARTIGYISLPFSPLLYSGFQSMSGYLKHYGAKSTKGALRRYRYPGKYGRGGSIPRRVRALEQYALQNAPEMKMAEFAASAATIPGTTLTNKQLTNIANGDDRSERSGYRIRIHKVEVRASAFAQMTTTLFPLPISFYIVLSKNNTSPTISDFSSGVKYPFIDYDAFTELKSWATDSNTNEDAQTCRKVKYFNPPLEITYSASLGTSCVRNELYLCILNNNTPDCQLDYSYRVFFTDH